MRTTVMIDDQLMQEALRLGGFKTKRETVEAALRALVRLRKQAEIRGWRGKVKWTGDLEEMRADRPRRASVRDE